MSIQVNNIRYSGNNIQTCSLVIDSTVYQIQYEKDLYKVISSGPASNEQQSTNQTTTSNTQSSNQSSTQSSNQSSTQGTTQGSTQGTTQNDNQSTNTSENKIINIKKINDDLNN